MVMIQNGLEMVGERFFGQFLCPLDVEFDVDSLHTNLLKKYRDAATNLDVGHYEIIVLYYELRLSVIGNVTIVIDSTREKPGTSLFEGPPGHQYVLELEVIRQDGFKKMNIALNDRIAPSGKDLFLNSIAESIGLLIPTEKRTHILALDIDVNDVGVPYELLIV
jgi:hypothetical protein